VLQNEEHPSSITPDVPSTNSPPSISTPVHSPPAPKPGPSPTPQPPGSSDPPPAIPRSFDEALTSSVDSEIDYKSKPSTSNTGTYSQFKVPDIRQMFNAEWSKKLVQKLSKGR